MKSGCPFFIQFNLSRDGQFLELSRYQEEHNHVVNAQLFKLHPKERRLPLEKEREAGELLHLHVNRKLLQAKLTEETGKQILMKDLSNIKARYRKPTRHLDEIVQKLKEEYGCSVNVLHNDNILQGVFFQDHSMRESFKSYPEILFIDGTYKLLNIRFTCYLFLIEDGNGNSEIVGVGLLAKEDEASMKWLIQSFKSGAIKFNETRTIMTDKDLTERKVLAENFPNSKLLICLFHVLRAFKREITTEKMGITSIEVQKAKELLTKLCYAVSEEQYKELYASFITSAPKPVVDYYNKNWHPIYNEWTHMAGSNGTFLNFTNNRVESMNAKLKSIIKPYSSLATFVDNFFVLLRCLRRERDNDAAECLLKVSSKLIKSDDPLYDYSKLLLPYPLKYLQNQLAGVRANLISEDQPGNFTFTGQGKSHPVNYNACSCISYNSMRIPCRHILAVRQAMNMPIFDKDLVDPRWTKDYLVEHQRVFVEPGEDGTECNLEIIEKDAERIPVSRNARFRQVSILASELADVASECTGSNFDKRIMLLQNILESWKNNKEISLCVHPSTCGNKGRNSEAVIFKPTNNDHGYAAAADGNDDFSNTEILSDCEDNLLGSPFHESEDHGFSATEAGIESSIVTETVFDWEDNSLVTSFHGSEGIFTSHKPVSNIPLSATSSGLSTCDRPASNVPSSGNFSGISTSDRTASNMPSSTSSDIPKSLDISLPPAVKRRGRSKGFEKTVIGLRRKTSRIVPFQKLPVAKKKETMLKWFTDSDIVEAILKNNTLIEEQDIEVKPENIPSACLDESIDLKLIKKHYTEDAWALIQNILKMKKKNNNWQCQLCHMPCLNDCVQCDGCLEWLHFSCAGAYNIARKKSFFCKTCHL